MSDITQKKLNPRKDIIDHALNDLYLLKKTGTFQNQYAVNENILFFEAIKSPLLYIKWLFFKAPKLERENLLELSDLPFPHWDSEMHIKLVELEKKDFPGLIKPLVNRIFRYILKENRRLILLNLGCGGMEIEQQVIKKLLNIKHNSQIIFVGLDKSQAAHSIAKNNLKEVESLSDCHSS